MTNNDQHFGISDEVEGVPPVLCLTNQISVFILS